MKVIKEFGSTSGWNILDWVKGNWTTIKELVKVGAPLLLGMAIFQNNPALISAVTIVGKLILDTLEYTFKEKRA